ncbi:MAG: PAS domain S-box protein [Calditrichaeota bacterium]|nr:PAS domain S-box protein [Calditrichota bacterium]
MKKNFGKLSHLLALKLTAIFLIPSVLWIILSDKFVLQFFQDARLVTEIQTYKGWFYVVVIAILLYWYSLRVYKRQHKREQDLANSERKNWSLLEYAGLSIGYFNLQGECVLINKKGCEYLEEEPENLVGKSVFELFGEDTGQKFYERIQYASDKKIVKTYEDEININTSMLWFSSTFAPIADSDGKISGIQIISADMTEYKKAEKELRESEARWQFALEGTGDGVWDWDMKGDSVYYSKRWKEMLGFEDFEIGTSLNEWNKRIHPDDKKRAYAELDKHIKGDTPFYASEHRVLCKDGNYKWVLDRGKIISYTGSGKPERMIGTHSDISTRKTYENAIIESEIKFKNLYNSMIEGVALHELIFNSDMEAVDYKVIDVNPAFENILGISKEQVIEKASGEAYGVSEPPYLNKYKKVALTGKAERFETYFKDMDKYFKISVFSTAKNKFATIFEDITLRKKTSDALEKQMEIFEKIINNIPVIIGFIEKDGGIAMVNSHMEKVFGWTFEEIKNHPDIFSEWYPDPETKKNVMKYINTADGMFKEFQSRRKDGKLLDTLFANVLLSDGRRIGIGLDMTEKKKQEKELHEAEGRLKLAIKASNVGLWDWDLVTNEVHFSPEWKSQIGYNDNEIENRFDEWEKRLHPDDVSRTLNHIKAFLNEPWPDYSNEFRLKHKDGSYRWILVRADLICDHNGKPVQMLGSHIDITEMKQTQVTLQNSEERYRRIVETAREGIWLIDKDSVTTFVNQSLLDMLGYAREEMIGKLFYSFMDSDDIALAKQSIQRRKAGMAEQHEFKFKKKNNTFIWTLINIAPILNSDLKYSGSLAMLSDITELKTSIANLEASRSELRALIRYIDDLIEEERTQLSRDIHDELGQLLTVLKIRLSFIEEDVKEIIPDKKEVDAKFLDVNNLIDSAVKNVNDILSRLRPETLDKVGLEASLETLSADFSRNTGIATQLRILSPDISLGSKKDLAVYRIIQEALTNIARHADASKAELLLEKSHNRFRLRISDNGHGIKKAKKTTKVHYGLIGMRERALSIGGILNIDSDTEGTRIQMDIPL